MLENIGPESLENLVDISSPSMAGRADGSIALKTDKKGELTRDEGHLSDNVERKDPGPIPSQVVAA